MANVQYRVQVGPGKDRLWIHSSDGDTVARFSNQFGVDIHTSLKEQEDGKPQCLHCTHTRPTAAEWQDFRTRVEELWGVQLAADLIVILTPQRSTV